MPDVKLKCSTCGKPPTPEQAQYTAKAGGTHWRFLQHGVGSPGRKANRNARKCGTWVEVADAG